MMLTKPLNSSWTLNIINDMSLYHYTDTSMRVSNLFDMYGCFDLTCILSLSPLTNMYPVKCRSPDKRNHSFSHNKSTRSLCSYHINKGADILKMSFECTIPAVSGVGGTEYLFSPPVINRKLK